MTDTIKSNNMKNIPIISTFLLVIAAVAISWLSLIKTNALEAKLSQIPPVVVVDFVSLVDSYGDMAPQELEQRMIDARDAVSALRDAGYLVLDAANIVAAPEDLVLTDAELGGNE